MNRYRVQATYHQYLYVDIDAPTDHDAIKAARELDMSDFIQDPNGGDFDVDSYEEEENPRLLKRPES